MTNGRTQQSLFSNPLVLLLVGMGVALVVVLLAIAVLQPGGRLKTVAYPPSSSTTAPARDQCECKCFTGTDEEQTRLCAVKWESLQGFGKFCEDDSWDYASVTESSECAAKNGTTCRGYMGYSDSGEDIASVEVYGELVSCKIISVIVSPTPTSPPRSR